MSAIKNQFVNISFYKFFEIKQDELPKLRTELKERCLALNLKGTVLLSQEGVNGFLAGTREAIDSIYRYFEDTLGWLGLPYKESISDHQPFTRMLVKLKKEIITMGIPNISPAIKTGRRVTAKELKQWYDQGKDFLILDTRNDYEIKIGTFERALDLELKTFRQFPGKVRELPSEVKEKTLVTFCTGGIRCEKATAFLENEGFKDVYQLDGGILRYFEEVGGDHYNGECFVFDHRVALDPTLKETGTALCFRCQAPVTAEEQKSASYVPNVSCPHCINGKLEHKERIAQEIIAKERTANALS